MNRDLNLLLGGQLVSQVGDKFHMLAVAFLVLKTTGSPAKMGLILFCSVFPSMLLGLISGSFIDRYNRKAIIIVADVARGLVVSGLAFCYFFNILSFPILLVAQVVLSVCTAFFDPAIPAIIPQIVQSDQLTRANSQAQLVSGIATVAGPTLGGIMVVWGGYLQTFFGLGMILTALLLSVINIAGREARFLFGGVFGIGLLMLLTGLIYFSGVRGIVAFLLIFTLIGAAVIMAGTSFRSILQKDVSADMMGRVFGFVAAVGNISIPLATLIYGLLMSYVSHGVLMAISGIALLPTSLAAYHIFTRTSLAQAANQSIKFEFSRKTD